MCYRTGDLGRYDSEGDVVAAGRADAQVKIRGFRVELAEIEATLGRHPLVSDCVVTAPIAAGAERRLAAYIVARAPAPTPDELRALLRDCLLYTSDAADDLLCVDLGGRRIIKKKKYK